MCQDDEEPDEVDDEGPVEVLTLFVEILLLELLLLAVILVIAHMVG